MFAVQVKKGRMSFAVPFPWRVSIVGFMANPLVLKGQAVRETVSALASDPFFDVIELNNLPDAAWEEARKAAEPYGVELLMGLQPLVLIEGKNPSSTDEDERKAAVEEIKKWVGKAAERGVRAVAFCSGPDPGKEKREAAKASLIKSLKEVCSYAQKHGILIVLETFDRDWDKKQLIGPIDEAVEVAKAVRSEYPNFGLMWDLSHGPMLNEKPEVLRKAKDYLVHIHIGCTKKTDDGLKDWHPGFYRPGAINGVDEVKELLAVLDEIGYSGAIGFEVKPESSQEWLEVVHAAKGVLYTAFARYIAEKYIA